MQCLRFFFGIFTVDDSVEILVNDRKKRIKKSQILWMLNNEKIRISSDIKLRYIPEKKQKDFIEERPEICGMWRLNGLQKGDYIIVKSDNCLYKGRVIAFQSCDTGAKKSKKNAEKIKKFSILHVKQIEIQGLQDFQVVLDSSIKISNEYQETINLLNEPIPLSQYLCHCQPDIDFQNDDVILEINKLMMIGSTSAS
jgi:hypothetical protein